MHIENYEYDIEPNKEGNIVISFDMLSQKHTLEITEKDLKRMLKYIELSKR